METVPLIIAGKQFRSRPLLEQKSFLSYCDAEGHRGKRSRNCDGSTSACYPIRKIDPFATILNYVDPSITLYSLIQAEP